MSGGRRPVVALLLVGLLLAGLGLVLPPPAGAVPPPAERSVRPNVVLVLTDDQDAQSLDRMPYVSSQPWVRFDQAFTENALCCPSRATVLQGRWDTHTGVTNNMQAAAFDPRETLPVWLQRAGYRTGLFGKYLNTYDGRTVPPGWDEWQVPFSNAIYDQYDYPLSNRGTVEVHGSAAADYQVDLLQRRAARFVRDSVAQGRRFFLELTPTATHRPWVASPTRAGAHAATPVQHAPSFQEPDVSDKPAWVRATPVRDPAVIDEDHRLLWDASLSVDDAVRRLDAVLTATGVRDRTVVVLLSDNGFSFGEHRWEDKRCEYDECARTPVLVRYPGQRARRDPHLVSNVDIAPTLASMGGATPTLSQDGRDLTPLVVPDGSAPSWRRAVLQHWSGGDGNGRVDMPWALPAFWAVRTPGERYVELVTGEREYYDLRVDPHELVNRARDPGVAGRVRALARTLDALKARADAAAVVDLPTAPPPGAGPFPPDMG